jgi:tetratricopeptide (TPR) repeat protein/tRNA A-37 threonylcarbamoyl transferase component Bud32
MAAPSITAGQLVGHYRIVEKIGGGGQGEVFRAHDERFDRDVALKILPIKALSDDAARKRFRQEAQAVGKLSHPNIATAFYFGEENGIDFLVTEYISGARLDEKLANGPLPEETVLALGAELASGLEAAHREGIIHRDLKPGNLRVTENGQLKILDFGLAELIDPKIDVAAAETVTLTMTLTGTLPYMAPEQFDGISDQRTDLWAAGVVLYELATGHLPFPETQLQRLKNAIKHQEPKRPSELNPAISPGLEAVILRALQKDPKRRYQTAGELRDDLARVAAGQKVKPNTWLRRHALSLAAGALLLAVAAYFAYRFWPRPPENTYRVLAVLPLETEGDDPADGALGRGVAQTVSARIAQGSNGRWFQLIPPNELRAKEVQTAEAARREFGVDMVLTVGLQRSGDKMRITCSLIDPRTHQQVDARTVTGDATDLFTLEDTAVTEVFSMLPKNAKSQLQVASEAQAAAPAGYEYYVRGRGYLQDYEKPENIDSAIGEFEHAIRIDPKYAPAHAGLGEAYWIGYQQSNRKDWLDKVASNCQESLTLSPNVSEGHACLGNFYFGVGKYEDAVKQYQRALDLDPDSDYSLGQLADAYLKLNRPGPAEDAYKKAISLRPNYWGVYSGLGNLYFTLARYSEAADMFRKVVELSPDNYHGYSNLGAAYLYLGQYPESIAALKHSIDLRPNRDAYTNLGAAYFGLRQFAEAADNIQMSLKLDAQDPLNWGNLGDALYWTPGRRSEAAAAYQKAIDLFRTQLKVNPRDAEALGYIATYNAMLDQGKQAQEDLKRALDLAPKNPQVLFDAAFVYNQLGDANQALEWLKKALDAGYSKSAVTGNPDFDRLQSNPNYRALIGK